MVNRPEDVATRAANNLPAEQLPVAARHPADPRMALTRVFIVDDHELFRDGLRLLLAREPQLQVCGEAGDEPNAVSGIRSTEPDVVVVDLSLQNGNGLSLVKWIKRWHPAVKVVVSTFHEEKAYGERAVRAGADGYVNKADPPGTLLHAIRGVVEGRLHFSSELTSRLLGQAAAQVCHLQESPVDGLSDRELEVFCLFGQGFEAGEIARRLRLSRSTVDTYRERLKNKMGIKSSSQLVYRAIHWLSQQDG